MIKFPESALAHKYLDGLTGIEIGGAAHNPFGLDTRNVDVTDSLDTVYKQQEIELCGEALPVDIVAHGSDLGALWEDPQLDFVISSHVLEHFYDPIGTLTEWYRVVKNGGYLFLIIPHKERTFDKDRPRTTLSELIERRERMSKPMSAGDLDAILEDKHWSVWATEDVVELIEYLGWKIVEVQDTDDKVGNGFTVVVKVEKKAPRRRAAKSAAPVEPAPVVAEEVSED